MAECCRHSPDRSTAIGAWCRIVGVVNEGPHVTHAQGVQRVRLCLRVRDSLYSIIGHNGGIDGLTALSPGDIAEIEGELKPHYWKGQDGKERFLATVETTAVRIIEKCRNA